jgi:hypothetical protein
VSEQTSRSTETLGSPASIFATWDWLEPGALAGWQGEEIRAKELRLSTIATRREMGAQLQDTAAADNYNNLFEMPVLFHVLCILIYVSGVVPVAQLVLAWVFVGGCKKFCV